MSRRQDEMDAAADAVLARPAAAAPAPRSNGPSRTRPVRLSVDITKTTYQDVKAYPDELRIPEQVGRVSIPTMEVMRALVDELLTNDEVRAAVAARLIRTLKK
jgi:hypothetical protein